MFEVNISSSELAASAALSWMKSQLVFEVNTSSSELAASAACSWPTAHRTPWAFVRILTFHLILHTCWTVRNWSGVGGGGDDNIPCTCTHVGWYATGQGWVGGMITFLALAHMLDATQLVRGGWGGMITFLALAHMLDATQLVRGGWGGMITFLALAHMLDATQLVRGGWVGDDNIPCTCTHVGCYGTGQGWVGWGG